MKFFRSIANYLSILFLVWLIFANFDISFDRNVIRLYATSEPSDIGNKDIIGFSRQVPLGVLEVRLRHGSVQITKDFVVSTYKNCLIVDLKNWTCMESNGTCVFGIYEGVYYTWACQHISPFEKYTFVTRLRYIVLGCSWDWEGGPQQMFTCALRPFVN
ncbi:hypothetical protein [Hoeflea sp.]|uniref:hypothetical protein n=1 Tax=Hoeflea sp. TaxID=1940281 RepID=UPI003B0240CB